MKDIFDPSKPNHMLRNSLLLSVLLILFSCAKHDDRNVGQLIDAALMRSLRDSLNATDFSRLDFDKTVISKYPDFKIARIGLKGVSLSEEFVLLQLKADGSISRGRIVRMERSDVDNTYNGFVVINSLSGHRIFESAIVNGYFTDNSSLSRVVPSPVYQELPEVIVVSTYPPGGAAHWSTWFSLVSFFDTEDYGGLNCWYSNADSYSGGAGGSFNGDYPVEQESIEDEGDLGLAGALTDEMIQVGFEQQFEDPAIDLDAFLRCFDNIPDEGATCRITIYADVPVNSDPTKMMDWSSGSPGHTWIQLEKTGAGQSASQHIGFYPKSGWKTTMTDAPIDGKFVDNAGHEFNASYSVDISAEDLHTAMMNILQLRNVRYDIDAFNCTDWALRVWRRTVSPSLWFDIPKFHMPGSLLPGGTSTPQGLYVAIEELHATGTAGTSVPLLGWSGASTGPCN